MESFSVRYQKKLLKPFLNYGRYRGKGKIQFFDDCLRISGRHVMSLGKRFGFGLALCAAAAPVIIVACSAFVLIVAGIFINLANDIPQFSTFNNFIMEIIIISPLLSVVAGILGVISIMEHVWLTKEDTIVPYGNVTRYLVCPHKRQVGIDFQGAKWSAPVVLQSNQWSQIQVILQERVPDRDSSLVGVTPSSGGRTVVRFLFVFLCSFAICSVLVFFFSLLFFPSAPLAMTGEPLNTSIWLLVFALIVILPLLIAMRNLRKNRSQ